MVLGIPGQRLTISNFGLIGPRRSALTQRPDDKGDFHQVGGGERRHAAPLVHSTPVLSPTTLLSRPAGGDRQIKDPPSKTTNTFGRESCIFHVSILTLRKWESIVGVLPAGGGSGDVESPRGGIVVSLVEFGNNPCKRVKTDGW